MIGVYFIAACIVTILVWKYLAQRFISKGKNKIVSHVFGAMAATVAFVVMATAIGSQIEVKPKVLDEASKAKQFQEDQQTLIAYFNKITSAKVYVDLHEQELTVNLDQNNIVQASETAKKCVEATKVLAKELDRGEYKAPILNDKEQSKALKTAIDKLVLGYDFRQAHCGAVYKYLDDRKPSIAAEIKEQKALADGTIDLAMTSIKNEIASKYRIEVLNGMYMAMK